MYRVNVIRNDNGQVTTAKPFTDLEQAMRYAQVVKRTNISVARAHCMIDRGDIRPRGRLISRAEIERLLGHNVGQPSFNPTSVVPNAKKEKTELEKAEEGAKLAEFVARKTKAEAANLEAEANIKASKGLIIRNEELVRREAELKEREDGVSAREDVVSGKEEKNSNREVVLRREEAKLRGIVKSIPEIEETMDSDLGRVRKVYLSLCMKCREKIPQSDLVWQRDFYENAEQKIKLDLENYARANHPEPGLFEEKEAGAEDDDE